EPRLGLIFGPRTPGDDAAEVHGTDAADRVYDHEPRRADRVRGRDQQEETVARTRPRHRVAFQRRARQDSARAGIDDGDRDSVRAAALHEGDDSIRVRPKRLQRGASEWDGPGHE